MSATMDLERAKRAAESLRSRVAGMSEEDWTLTIESETGLVEAVDRVLAEIDDAEVMLEGILVIASKLSARADRYHDRVQRLKEALCLAMQAGDLQKIERPSATLSLKRVPPGLVITDEAKIPMDYFVRQDPRLDRKALLAALKDKQEIPGVTLGNGEISIQLRRA